MIAEKSSHCSADFDFFGDFLPGMFAFMNRI